MRKKLVIPIEIKSRELLPALYLSKIFLKNDWDVYIGQKQQIFPYIKIFSESVFFLKSIVPGEKTLIQKIKRAGHFIATSDPEGLSPNPPGILSVPSRFSDETIELTDIIFFWGKKYYSDFKKIFGSQLKKKIVSGSHIFDYWKFIGKKKPKKQKTILITTSLSLVNSNQDYFTLMKDNYKEGLKKDHVNLLKRQIKIQKFAFLKYQELLKQFDKNPLEKKIILRPHPAENLEFWHKFRKKLKNIELIIDNKDKLENQITDASHVIHFGSTLSYQVRANNKIPIYYPKINVNDLNKNFNRDVADISHEVKSATELHKKLIGNSFKKKKSNLICQNNIEGFSKKDLFYSSKIIYKNINKRFKKKTFLNNDPFNYSFFIFLIIYKFKNLVARFLAIYFSFIPYIEKRFGLQKGRIKGKNYKWSATNKKELYEFYKQIKISDTEIKIKKHFSGFFKISQK